jgi:hypothetical protein
MDLANSAQPGHNTDTTTVAVAKLSVKLILAVLIFSLTTYLLIKYEQLHEARRQLNAAESNSNHSAGSEPHPCNNSLQQGDVYETLAGSNLFQSSFSIPDRLKLSYPSVTSTRSIMMNIANILSASADGDDDE